MGSESVMTSCVDSYSDVFSHVDYGECLVDEFSSAGIVPYISESKVKCAVLVLLWFSWLREASSLLLRPR